MKAGTESKLKFKKLQRRLKLKLWQAVGLLESLWQVTARDAPRGDIGKFSNEDIATHIEWEGDEDELIDALVDIGWLDEDSEFRLLVHNWPEHAPNYVKGVVKQYHGGFAVPNQVPNQVPDQVADQVPDQVADQVPDQVGYQVPYPETPTTKPSLAKRSVAKPSVTITAATAARTKSALCDDDAWRAVAAAAADFKNLSLDCFEAARSNGCSPAEVLEILDYYHQRSDEFGVGALHERLSKALPGAPPGNGWPRPRAASKKPTEDRAKRIEDRRQLIIRQYGVPEAADWTADQIVSWRPEKSQA